MLGTPIDDTNQRILDLLAQDSRRSASEIGRIVGLSPPAAKRRITRLEDDGLIAGYTALIDYERLGKRIEAFIELRFAPGTQVDDIDAAVAHVPEVLETFTLAGDPDSLVRVRVADLDQLKRVVDQIRRGRQGGPKVTETRTKIVLGRSAPAAAR